MQRPSVRPTRLGLALGLAVSLVLTACGSASSGGSSGTSSGGLTPGTVSLVALASDQPGMVQVVKDWEKIHPDVKIQAKYPVAGTQYSAVATEFAGGNGEDLVWLIAGAASTTSAQAFAKAGYLADLSKESWVPSMYPPTKPQYSRDGKVYVRDGGLSPLAIMSYNKAYFKDHKLTAPTTFSQLLSMCRTISADHKTPISWGAGVQAVNTNDLAVMAGNTVFSQNPTWVEQRIAGKTTFASTPGWRESLQQIVDMKNANCFKSGAAGASLNEMISDFASGQAAMMFTYGGLDGNVLQLTPDLSIGMFALPAASAGNSRITLQAAGGLGLNAKSKVKADAKAFLDFWSTPQEQKVFAERNNLISANQASTGKVSGIYTDIQPYFTNNKVLEDPTAKVPNTSFNTNAGASIQGLFTGQKTVPQVLADMDKFFDAK